MRGASGAKVSNCMVFLGRRKIRGVFAAVALSHRRLMLVKQWVVIFGNVNTIFYKTKSG